MRRVVGGSDERWLLKSSSVVISLTVDMIAGQLAVKAAIALSKNSIRLELILLFEKDQGDEFQIRQILCNR